MGSAEGGTAMTEDNWSMSMVSSAGLTALSVAAKKALNALSSPSAKATYRKVSQVYNSYSPSLRRAYSSSYARSNYRPRYKTKNSYRQRRMGKLQVSKYAKSKPYRRLNYYSKSRNLRKRKQLRFYSNRQYKRSSVRKHLNYF